MRFPYVVMSLVLGICVTVSLHAQPPEGRRPRPDGPPRDGDLERPHRERDTNRPGPPRDGELHRFPPLPILQALDSDQDGEISAKEIENASTALKTLDKNNDGKLTIEEIRPQFPRRGDGDRRGPRPDFRGPRDGRDGPRFPREDGAPQRGEDREGPPRPREEGAPRDDGERPRRPQRPEA